MNNQTCHLKLKTPIRNQVEMNLMSLDSLLPAEHRARSVWAFVEQMDTSPCFEGIKTFFGCVGRAATTPQVLFALWLYSILDGNSSARKLEELCKNHNVYRWLTGGVPINRTMLADFRSKNPLKFEDLLTTSLAVMLKAKLISDVDFAQDGTRVKANAGFNSYKREESLEQLKLTIKEYIKQLDKEVVDCTDSYEKREKEKKEKIAKERLSRVEDALKTLQQERIVKTENGKKKDKNRLKMNLAM